MITAVEGKQTSNLSARTDFLYSHVHTGIPLRSTMLVRNRAGRVIPLVNIFRLPLQILKCYIVVVGSDVALRIIDSGSYHRGSASTALERRGLHPSGSADKRDKGCMGRDLYTTRQCAYRGSGFQYCLYGTDMLLCRCMHDVVLALCEPACSISPYNAAGGIHMRNRRGDNVHLFLRGHAAQSTHRQHRQWLCTAELPYHTDGWVSR